MDNPEDQAVEVELQEISLKDLQDITGLVLDNGEEQGEELKKTTTILPQCLQDVPGYVLKCGCYVEVRPDPVVHVICNEHFGLVSAKSSVDQKKGMTEDIDERELGPNTGNHSETPQSVEPTRHRSVAPTEQTVAAHEPASTTYCTYQQASSSSSSEVTPSTKPPTKKDISIGLYLVTERLVCQECGIACKRGISELIKHTLDVHGTAFRCIVCKIHEPLDSESLRCSKCSQSMLEDELLVCCLCKPDNSVSFEEYFEVKTHYVRNHPGLMRADFEASFCTRCANYRAVVFKDVRVGVVLCYRCLLDLYYYIIPICNRCRETLRSTYEYPNAKVGTGTITLMQDGSFFQVTLCHDCALSNHVRTEAQPCNFLYQFSCETCGWNCGSFRHLQDHMRTDHSATLYCVACAGVPACRVSKMCERCHQLFARRKRKTGRKPRFKRVGTKIVVQAERREAALPGKKKKHSAPSRSSCDDQKPKSDGNLTDFGVQVKTEPVEHLDCEGIHFEVEDRNQNENGTTSNGMSDVGLSGYIVKEEIESLIIKSEPVNAIDFEYSTL